ncbi:MAG: tyrosine-type recombinase/integrase [Thermomicrobiales bacterium]
MPEPIPLAELISEYLDHHRAYGRSIRTIAHYSDSFRLLVQFLDEAGVAQSQLSMTTATMRTFSTWLQETPLKLARRGTTRRSIAGIHGVLRDMRAFTRWLEREEKIERPVRVPLPRLPQQRFRILTKDEIELVWSSRYMTGRSPMAVRNRALLGLMLDTGLRRGEVCSLRIEDVDFDNLQLLVTGKGNKQRIVPFVSRVKQALLEWMHIRGNEPGTLFWLQPSGVRMVFRRIQEELELPVFHPHQLRHQAATTMVLNKMDLERVRIVMGHSAITTTHKYLSMSTEDVREGHAAASPFNALIKEDITASSPRRRRMSSSEW